MNRMALPNPRKTLLLILWLIAIHSIGFGIALIIFPCSWLEYFGFTITQKFFATQGGVFHLIISYVYIRAAIHPENSRDWIFLACLTKFSASLFLLTYYIFATPILMVLLSSFMDGLMALAILLAYRWYRNANPQNLTL